MNENRPPDWDWVKATGECTAASMFSTLRDLACRDIQERNEQLKRNKFTVGDVDTGGFWAGPGDWDPGKSIFFHPAFGV